MKRWNNRFSFRFYSVELIDKICFVLIIFLSLIIASACFIYEISNNFAYAYIILAILVYATFPFLKIFPDRVPLIVYTFSITSLFLTGIAYTEPVGYSPIILITEAWLLIVILLRYDIKTATVIIGVYLLLALFRNHINTQIQPPFQVISMPNPSFSYFWLFLLSGLMILRLSHFFVQNINRSKRLLFTSDVLLNKAEKIKEQTRNFEREYNNLGKVASINSHEMRRPVARTQAVIQMYDDLMDQGLDPEEHSSIILYEELEKNMQDILRETDAFEQHIGGDLKKLDERIKKRE